LLPTLKPVTDIKRHAVEIIAQLRSDRIPVLITDRGREAAVMLDVGTYRGMLKRLELLESIAEGERDFREGRFSPHEEMVERMEKRWG